MSPAENPAAEQTTHVVTCAASDTFADWMRGLGGSLFVSTYQANRVALLGWNGQQVSFLMREFDKPLGLALQQNCLALATRHELFLFANAPVLAHDLVEDQPDRYDALYLPRAAYFTGDLNIHDVRFGADGPWFVNTRFSCLCRPSSEFSFVPCWTPPFVSELVPEDRCHLNGLAMEEGRPKFVTALGATDEVGGWRLGKRDGGVVIDVDSGEIVLRGLSMPHSPRMYDGALWLLNSGKGELICVDSARGTYGVVCTLPGYLRGLAFVGPYAVVGLCQIRERHIFGGMPVLERFAELICGLVVVDLRTGKEVGQFRFTSGCQELYDIAFLPGVRQPTILNREALVTRQAFAAPEFAYWLRPSALVRTPDETPP